MSDDRAARLAAIRELADDTPDENDGHECRACGGHYTLREGAEPTPECDPCSVEILGQLRAEAQWLLAEVDRLEAEQTLLRIDMTDEQVAAWASTGKLPDVVTLRAELAAAQEREARLLADLARAEDTIKFVTELIAEDNSRRAEDAAKVARLREALSLHILRCYECGPGGEPAAWTARGEAIREAFCERHAKVAKAAVYKDGRLVGQKCYRDWTKQDENIRHAALLDAPAKAEGT